MIIFLCKDRTGGSLFCVKTEPEDHREVSVSKTEPEDHFSVFRQKSDPPVLSVYTEK